MIVHRLIYRLPSGNRATVLFTVARSDDGADFRAALNDRIAATKALYER
jgi:hypothetical protein